MLSDKKLSKIEKILGSEILEGINACDYRALEAVVVQAETNIKDAEEELEANPKYQELKENLKALSQGLKEIKKFQRAKIAYVLHTIEQRGKS